MPAQEQADAWTAERTLGLIEKFPIGLQPLTADLPTAVALASALATRIRWSTPFYAAREQLGGAFAQAQEVLSAPRQHEVYLADTAAAGRVAVHTAWSDNGLKVLSVIAEPDRIIGDVHQAALDVATRPDYVDLFDVPLGCGHAWTLDESVKTMDSDSDRVTTAHALLPAWDAGTDLDLSAEPWFGAAAAVMSTWGIGPEGVEGRQSAVASYDRTGFAAAAVTALGVRGAAYRPSREVRVRHLEIRFDRPYAVVAVACQQPYMSTGPTPKQWVGVPVFNAWVADPR